MMAVGFTKSPSTIDLQNFLHEFRHYCNELLGDTPYAQTSCMSCDAWAAKLVRKHRCASHPLYHLLLQSFLEEHQKAELPFGEGPWPCLNPLATHFSSNSIGEVRIHRNREKLVGVFQCECGYAYTRNAITSSTNIGPPRLLRYGPLLPPVLQDGIARGISLRGIARLLDVDPKTVVLLAKKLGISTPWKVPVAPKAENPFSHTRAAPRTKNEKSGASHTVSSLGKVSREPWSSIDSAFVACLPKLVDLIRLVTPPIRISVAEFERRISRRGWIYKNREHLPQTVAFLQNVIEDTDTFQTRRIKWEIDRQMQAGGEIRVWRVMRKAGISSKGLEKIKTILNAMEYVHLTSNTKHL